MRWSVRARQRAYEAVLGLVVVLIGIAGALTENLAIAAIVAGTAVPSLVSWIVPSPETVEAERMRQLDLAKIDALERAAKREARYVRSTQHGIESAQALQRAKRCGTKGTSRNPID